MAFDTKCYLNLLSTFGSETCGRTGRTRRLCVTFIIVCANEDELKLVIELIVK
jgi:hypothetical protein